MALTCTVAPSTAATVAAAVAAPVPHEDPWWADPGQDPWRAQDGEAIPEMAHVELPPLEEEVNGEEGMVPPRGDPVVLGPSSNGFGVQPTMGSGCGPTVAPPGWPPNVPFPGVVPPMNACVPPLHHPGLWHPGVYQHCPPGVPAPGLLPGHAPVPLWHPGMMSPCCGGCWSNPYHPPVPSTRDAGHDGSGSWSKPTTPEGGPVRPRPSSRRMPPSQPPSEPGGGDGGSDDGGDDDPDLPEGPEAPSLRSSTVATSEVRSMLRRRAKKEDQQSRPRSSLGSVKIEEFYGDRSRYLKWKRAIEAQQHLYELQDGELSMLIYLSTRREARDVVEQHPIGSYTGAGGLHLLWRVLDEAFGESEAELFERADRELERCRRQPGEAMAHYLAEMRRLRAQYYRIDPGTKISDKAWGQKLLQRASLTRRERLDCYYAAGATYESLAIEKALRVRCGRVHEDEKKINPIREREHREPRETIMKKKVFMKRKLNHTHVADQQEQEASPEIEEAEMEDEPSPEVQERFGEAEDDEQEDDDELSEGELEEDELREVFTAGWRAKQRTAEIRKNRGWKSGGGKSSGKGGGKQGSGQSTDERKKLSRCSSCDQVGHWKGDPECPNVQSGKDPLHKKVNYVNFTFMVGGGLPPPGTCSGCRWPVPEVAKFCQNCGQPQAQDERMAKYKRPSRDDHWDLVDPPEPRALNFEVSGRTARTAAHVRGRSEDFDTKVKLGTQEMITALPAMTKSEKKELMRALEDEERRDAWTSMERHRILLEREDGIHGGYRDERMYGVGSASSQAPILPKAKPLIRPPSTDRDVPKAIKDRDLKEFRDALYDSQVLAGGRLPPSSAAPTPTEVQARCPHPRDQLRWHANGDGHYARCKQCDLKHVLYFSTRHGVLMVSDTYFARESGVKSLAIADSGCRNAVGGRWWHDGLQQELGKLALPFFKEQESEVYRFGAGDPIVSREAFIYPVSIHGQPDWVRISVVEGDAIACPGLVGPSELSRWEAVFRFQNKEMELCGVRKPMVLTSTRHPGIDLLDLEDTEKLRQFCDSEPGRRKRHLLFTAPQSLSFVAENSGTEESEEEKSPSGDDDDESAGRVGWWMNHLEMDLGIKNVPVVDMAKGDQDEEESSEASEHESVTSHERGIEMVSDGSSEDEDQRQEINEGFEALVSTEVKTTQMHKHLRKRLKHQVKEIKETFHKEDNRTSQPLLRDPQPMSRPQVKSKWSVLEVFTWTCAITMMAASRGWIAHEPITLPRWNILNHHDYNQALDYIDRVNPDLLVLAWPCTVWSQLQAINATTPWRRSRLAQRRKEQRRILRFVRDACQRQRRRGGAVLGENPHRSRAWTEPMIVEAFDGMDSGVPDMCQFKLRIPGGRLLRKRTLLKGTKEVVRRCTRKCCGDHQHDLVFGSAKINGKWTTISDFAGGYTKQFAQAVVEGAEEYLKGRSSPGSPGVRRQSGGGVVGAAWSGGTNRWGRSVEDPASSPAIGTSD